MSAPGGQADGPYAMKSELDPSNRTRGHRNSFFYLVPHVKVIRNIDYSGLVERMWFVRMSKDLGDVFVSLTCSGCNH